MKNSFLPRTGLLLLLVIISFVFATAQQSAVVGEIRNNAMVITNAFEAANVLSAGIEGNVTVSNLRIEWVGGSDNHYYLIGEISGDMSGSKGVQLTQNGIQLHAVAGPGVELTCVGTNCSQCILVFRKWKPYCECKQVVDPQKSYACDMISKYIVTPW